MDSPHLLGVGFLFLALTAPHPNVAMPSAPSAERTHDSSSGKTDVTVYHCRDCPVSICEKHSSVGFAKIAKTQNTTFSNGTIQLETEENRIRMCFQQADTFPEGIYRIVWEKTGGAGDSCGNPSSTGENFLAFLKSFSDNERGTISTMGDKICCEAKTITSESDPTLNCSTEKSDTTKGVPSERKNIGITLALVLLLVLCATMTIWYYRERHQHHQGGENEQSPDVISVWEGDSISITCSIRDSGNHVGMLLKHSGRYNVVYSTWDGSPNISPAFVGRAKCSREGRNYRITLHNVQESDSHVYLCTEYVKTDDDQKFLDGKRTIVVVKAKSGEALEQSPLYASPQQGQSVSIACGMHSSGAGEGIYLLKTHVQPEEVLQLLSQSAARISPAFAGRLNYSKEGKQVVITLHNLQKNDTDNYVCAEQVTTKNTRLLSARGTMVLVKDAEGQQAYSQQPCSGSSWAIYSLSILVALLLCALVFCTLYHVNLKKYFQKKTPNVVYEDMSYSSRRNTLVRSNTLCKAN
ncbi:T-cell antigen CD7 isoform X1 [Willisornis vidua]|uniref:T-cell antigen CD7 isoform X1 n=1 Tax=Willisornis vidua TaxID=1566151 RepID=A0ABQ9CPX9_9PASS|nr:T-cell antigen CD7 isoform X1 [Willisornis vidua]